MDVRLDQNDQAFVDQLVAEGRYGSASEAVHDGLRILREREGKLASLRESINRSIEQGGSYTSEEVLASVDELLDSLEREDVRQA